MSKLLLLLLFLFVTTSLLAKQYPDDLVGHWTFNNPDSLTEASIGNNLILTGTHTAIEGPSDSTGAVRIGIGSFYSVVHDISPNGGGSLVNDYTIVMDVKVSTAGLWHALYQTDASNTDDGDWFINLHGNIGISEVGYTPNVLIVDDWYRIAISVSNGERYDYYISGLKSLSGTSGSVDGRFSLESQVLFFADNNSEDNLIDIADIKIFSRDLSDDEIGELGSFEHEIEVIELDRPYLQSPTSTSIYVCWAYDSDNPYVEYGLTPSLGNQVTPETVVIDIGDAIITWYAAKLENLEPSTSYYYQVGTDSIVSDIYKFRTQPIDADSTEHIRFAVYGDNRTVPVKFEEVNDSLKSKIISLYGENIEDEINFVFNVGDIVTNGNTLTQYVPEYFNPIRSISTSIPFMVSIGNHETESPLYYDFMKYEDFGGAEGEKYYSFRTGKVLSVMINSNVQFQNDTQIEWLNQVLTNAQSDETIEWVFVFLHHPGRSELWPDGNTNYVQDMVIPTLLDYPKVDMLTYGHSHNYERGTALNGGFRLMLNGGAGSDLDRWGLYPNQENYPEIQKTFDHYCYSIVDIDIPNKSYEVTTYSLGNLDNPLDNVVIDHFFRNKANETPPNVPLILLPEEETYVETPFVLSSSDYTATYEIMSSQFQITNIEGNYDAPVLNILRDYEDIYGTPLPPNYIPIDLNEGIDLTEYIVPSLDSLNGQVWARVRYRDQNLQWSNWSAEHRFLVNDSTNFIEDVNSDINEYKLYSNYPNPFNPSTTIQYDLLETSIVSLNVYNYLGELVAELENGVLPAGHYTRKFDASELSSGVYYYSIKAGDFKSTKKMILVK